MRASFRARPMAPSRGDRPTVGREGAPTAISPAFLKLLADEDLAGRTVLDVGTGRGRLALALAPAIGLEEKWRADGRWFRYIKFLEEGGRTLTRAHLHVRARKA